MMSGPSTSGIGDVQTICASGWSMRRDQDGGIRGATPSRYTVSSAKTICSSPLLTSTSAFATPRKGAYDAGKRARLPLRMASDTWRSFSDVQNGLSSSLASRTASPGCVLRRRRRSMRLLSADFYPVAGTDPGSTGNRTTAALPARRRSVAVRRAQGEVVPVRACLVDGAGKGGTVEQAAPVVAQPAELRIDPVHPVGIEKRRRRGTVGHREIAPAGPCTPCKIAFQPGIGRVELAMRFGDAMRVAHFDRAQTVAHDLLHRRRYVVVEKAVQGADFEGRWRLR